MSAIFDLTVHMLSDWHIGTGTGRHGQLSSRVLVDVDGLPYIPAKTVNGVLRDGCEIAARALDGGNDGPWGRRVEYVFGSQPVFPGTEAQKPPEAEVEHPRPAALRYLGAFRLPDGLGAALRADPRLKEAVTFVKPGVAHDRVSGSARQDMLRFDEMARGGVTLAGKIELPETLQEDELNRVLTLLYLGTRLVEGTGAKRRRGSGRCRLELGWEPTDLDAWTESKAEPPEPEPLDEPEKGGNGPSANGAWERVLLRMTLDEPLLAHQRTVGNLVQSRDHIPGWMMLGEVLRRLGGPAAAAARRGDLVVTNATPLLDGRRGCPAPQVFERGKEDGRLLVNRMRESSESVTKRLRGGYVTADAGKNTIEVHRPEFVLRMHNTIQDESQRPTEDLGGVYVYKALAAGTVLAAEVRVRAGLLDGQWEEKLKGKWRLGRSRKDDYGIVDVDLLEAGDEPSGTATGDVLRVWLVSDVLVRNERLAPSTVPRDLARALAAAFEKAGAPGVELDPVTGDADLVPNRYEISRTESWHTGWRLPRPVLLGFAAGGCLTFRITQGTITPDAAAAVELAGIGDRRAEGFGQIRLNDPFLDGEGLAAAEPNEDAVPTAPVGEPLAPSDPGYTEARTIERAAWRAEIRRASEQAAARSDAPVLGGLTGLSATRLNSLRGLFPHLGEDETALKRRVATLTGDWGDKERAEVERLLVGTEPWELLRIPDLDELRATVDGAETHRAELRAEARRTMITACLAVHTRREALGEEGR